MEQKFSLLPMLAALVGDAAVKRQPLGEILRQWREEGDEEEQRETGEFLIRALDEDRLSGRKLFS